MGNAYEFNSIVTVFLTTYNILNPTSLSRPLPGYAVIFAVIARASP
ncbi:MAG: hypothetical protein ACI92G_001825 [Candidatus Pelagisphaera sp.]|jgi:hypothetical protein